MRKRMVVWLAMVALLAMTPLAQAAVTLETSRVGMGGTDFIDWGNLGPAYTEVPNPFSITSNGGLNVNVSKLDTSTFERRDQGTGWAGNFAPGDHLLWTSDYGYGINPIALMDFGSLGAVAVGAQIQSDDFGDFVAKIEAFDGDGVSLGSFLLDGNSTSAGDNSAIFIGVSSTSIMHSVEFSLVDAPYRYTPDFAINQVDFTPGGGQIPEPTTLVIWSLLGAVGIAAGWWRRRNAT